MSYGFGYGCSPCGPYGGAFPGYGGYGYGLGGGCGIGVGPYCGYGGYGGGSNYGRCGYGQSNCANCLNQANANLCARNQAACYNRNYVYVQANESGYNNLCANQASNCLAAKANRGYNANNCNSYRSLYPYGAYGGCC